MRINLRSSTGRHDGRRRRHRPDDAAYSMMLRGGVKTVDFDAMRVEAWAPTGRHARSTVPWRDEHSIRHTHTHTYTHTHTHSRAEDTLITHT